MSPAGLVEKLLLACGHGPVLVASPEADALVQQLRALGVDAVGIAGGAKRLRQPATPGPGGAPRRTALVSGWFDDCNPRVVDKDLATLAGLGVHQALFDVALDASRDRAWWETRLFAAGWRKHPAYYLVNDYAGLGRPHERALIPCERLPDAALAAYPVEALAAERDLHMDMLRESGERSDGHVVRYQWASRFVRSGDRVLDAACGLGYGAYVLGEASEASSILGIDGSAYAADYARANFAAGEPRLAFTQGLLPEALAAFPDGSFDVIVSFETLEHLAAPTEVLDAFSRLLSPGGRIVVGVPNDWSDASGEDPNPHHLQVYDWARLRAEIGERFLTEVAAVQTASACKVDRATHRWERRPRSFEEVAPASETMPDAEWLLVVGMKDPVGATTPYRETFYGYAQPPRHLLAFERDYANPWLVRAMVEFPTRARDAATRERMARAVLATERGRGSADEGAALAVLGYARLDAGLADDPIVADIEGFLEEHASSAHAYRWAVSLRFLLAQWRKRRGDFDGALAELRAVADEDVTVFSPALGTKVVEAAYEAGMLLASAGRMDEARSTWWIGVHRAHALFQQPLAELVGDPAFPQHFVAITLLDALDSATRCLRALRFSAEGRDLPARRLYAESRQSWKWMLEERARALAVADRFVGDRDEAVAAQARLLEARWNMLQAAEARVRDLEGAVASQATLVEARDEAIASQAALLEARWTLLQEAQAAIAVLDAALGEQASRVGVQAALVVDRDNALAASEARVRDRDAALAATEALVRDRDAALAATEALVRDRDAALAASDALIRDRDAALAAMEGLIRDRDAALAAADALVRDRDAALAATEALVRDRDAALSASEALVRDRGAALAATEALVRDRDAALAASDALVRARDAALAATETLVRDRDATLAATEALVRDRDAALAATEALVRDRDAALAATEALARDREAVVAATEALVRDRDAALAAQAAVLETRWQLLQDAAAAVEQRDRALRELTFRLDAAEARASDLDARRHRVDAHRGVRLLRALRLLPPDP